MDEPQKFFPSVIVTFDRQQELFRAGCSFLRPVASFVPVLIGLLFVGTFVWATKQNPFASELLTIRTLDQNSFKCVAVLPKPMRRYPVVIYVHDSGDSLMNDGYALRQMAEMGLAVVGMDNDQGNEFVFTRKYEAVLQCVDKQKWAETNAVAWVGFNLGAIRTFNFALQHPNKHPQLLIQLSDQWVDKSTINYQLSTNLHCPVVIIHGDQDEICSVADFEREASLLQRNGVPVSFKIMHGLSHNLEPDLGVIYRGIGEYCRSRLAGGLGSYHSVAQWQAEAPPFWLFCLPVAAWIAGWFAWCLYCKVGSPDKIKFSAVKIALRWISLLFASWAFTMTSIHLATPHFTVSNKVLSIARRYLVQPKDRADFEFLAAQPIWHQHKLRSLLDHVELAGYNRELINWQLDEEKYREYVLSPTITGEPDQPLSWRRPLWEEFYPRIRHESSPEDAAKVVVRHLRERVTIADLPNLSHEVPEIWLKQITDEAGFEIIYVAALRSVGVPARLDSHGKAEFWSGSQWQTAPAPAIVSW